MRRDIYEAILVNKKDNIKVNYAAMAKAYNCDPRTVKRYFEERDSDPKVRKTRIVPKKMDGFEAIVEDKYINSKAPGIAIFHFIRDKHGFTGSYSTVKQFIQKLRNNRIHEATVRFETLPGYQCQIDWKENLTLNDRYGNPHTINIFLAILGFSRLKYIELTLDKTQPTLFQCLTNSIKYFGGTPKEFLFDNMKTVADRARTQYNNVVLNQRFYEFTKDAGFKALSCVGWRPRTKGKVEVVAKIMNRIRVFDNEFDTLEELNNIIIKLREDINNEINQTTKERPISRYKEKEKEYLADEPRYEILKSYFSDVSLCRKVGKDSLVTFKNAKYSVDPKYIGKKVFIEEENDYISIIYNNKIIG